MRTIKVLLALCEIQDLVAVLGWVRLAADVNAIGVEVGVERSMIN